MCTVLFIFGAAGCAVKSDKQKEELNLKFQHTAQDREVGETQSMITYENHYAYGIHYPAIGVEAIDSRIKAAAQEIADGFVKEVPNSKPKGELPTLSADYKSYLVTDNGKNKYVSIVFEIKTDIPDKSIKTDSIETLVFDIPSGKQLSADDIFSDGYEKIASTRVVSYFTANRLFNAGVGSDKFKQNTSADKKNFTKFSISSDSLTFYFDSGVLFGEDKGCVEAVFQLNDIKPIFSTAAAKVLLGAEAVTETTQQSSTKPESTTQHKKPNLPAGSNISRSHLTTVRARSRPTESLTHSRNTTARRRSSFSARASEATLRRSSAPTRWDAKSAATHGATRISER